METLWGSARRGEAGPGCAAGAGAVALRSGLKIRRVFEAPAVVAGLDNVAVMGEAVEERGGHLWIAEHAWPFAEGEV